MNDRITACKFLERVGVIVGGFIDVFANFDRITLANGHGVVEGGVGNEFEG